jgi:hypothetical protein
MTTQVTSGTLPPGLTINSRSGRISGVPTTAGLYTLALTTSNGISPAASHIYRISVTGFLAQTGSTSTWVVPWALAATLIGGVLAVGSRLRMRRPGSNSLR